MSRFDAFGMFWQDMPREKGDRSSAPRPMPPIPDTGWKAPTSFPNLSAARALCIDTETKDPDLLTKGPGWATGNGHVVGIGVGTDDGHRWYFPMRHEVGGGNLDPDMVLRWARKELTRKEQPKLFANAEYDVGWLLHEDVHVQGKFIDVQYAEPLLDEHAHGYSLGALGEKYIGESKTEDALYDWCYQAYGGKEGRPQAGNIWRAPISLVGPYAEGDVDLPFKIWRKQKKLLIDSNLEHLMNLECRLIPILVKMRAKGIRINFDAAEKTHDYLGKKMLEVDARLKHLLGTVINVDANDDIERAFKKLSLPYARTTKGNASFTKPLLEAMNHELPSLILERRKWAKIKGTFIDGYVLGKAHNGRIHGQFHPLRKDGNGTISGRFSSSDPNLQNIPARDPVAKKLTRGLFLPEEGDWWWAPDYSQVEYRLMVNAAKGPGAEEAREAYRRNPKTDYHNMTQEMIEELFGRKVSRKPTKNINFGKIFGMGKDTLIRQLPGLTLTEAEEFFDTYDEAVPYAKTTADAAARAAANKAVIKTILGRHARFPFWEPSDWELSRRVKYNKDKDAMIQLVIKEKQRIIEHNKICDPGDKIKIPRSGVRRALTHKALNCYTQGGGGDIIKKAMVDCYEQGGHVPLLTVHDELGFSLPEVNTDILRIQNIMENAVQLKVPLLVDIEAGPDWGHVEKWEAPE